MQKSRDTETGDAGHLYVRLIDSGTGAIREVEADVADGAYVWQLENIPACPEERPACYQLVAFTDSDSDKQICDSGEACGAYLTTVQPTLVEVQEGFDRDGLDFQVGFGAAFY